LPPGSGGYLGPAAPPSPSKRHQEHARAPPRALPASPADGLSVAIAPADPRRKQAKDEDENEGIHFDDPPAGDTGLGAQRSYCLQVAEPINAGISHA
jgi:hypothetical protein